MKSLVLDNPVAAAALAAAFIAAMTTELEPQRITKASDAPQYDLGSKRFLVITIWLGLGLAVVFAAVVRGATIGGPRWLPFGAGLALLAAGAALRIWSIRTLGSSFTHDVRVAPGQAVVTGGPYRFVRHPSYTGGLLICAGVGLGLGNWLALATAVVIPLVGYVRRIRVEEDALRTHIGATYDEYAADRRRLIPLLW